MPNTNSGTPCLTEPQRQALINYLQDLGEFRAYEPRLGMCQLVWDFVHRTTSGNPVIATVVVHRLLLATPCWPHFSGRIGYPVPPHKPRWYSDRHALKAAAHRKYHSCNDRWNTRTRYGRLRRELCLWLANEIREGRIITTI
jgi:hypothetical protein